MYADKYQTFLQVDTINVSAHGQACPNYAKQQVCKIFAIFQNLAFRAKVRPRIVINGPKWSVLDFDQNWVINIGWNHFETMDNVIF